MVAECIMATMNNKNTLNNERFSIPIVLGHDAQGNEMIVDLKRLPHLLIGGVSGSGKTVFLNSLPHDWSGWPRVNYADSPNTNTISESI